MCALQDLDQFIDIFVVSLNGVYGRVARICLGSLMRYSVSVRATFYGDKLTRRDNTVMSCFLVARRTSITSRATPAC